MVMRFVHSEQEGTKDIQRHQATRKWRTWTETLLLALVGPCAFNSPCVRRSMSILALAELAKKEALGSFLCLLWELLGIPRVVTIARVSLESLAVAQLHSSGGACN